MKASIGRLVLCISVAAAAWSQGTPGPFVKQQYFSNSGQPLAGGSLCSSVSGTTAPLATFSDYTLTQANPQCVVLDSAGRAAIWMDPTKTYRFVLRDSASVIIWSQDGIPGSGSGSGSGGGGGTLWTQSGSTVYNSAGSKVCVGATACTTALATFNVAGTSSGSTHTVRIDDTASNPGMDLYGSGSFLGAYFADATGLRLRSANGSNQITVANGGTTIQNGSASGGTTLNLKMSATQGSVNPLQVQTSAGSNVAYIDPNGNGFLNGLSAAGTATNIIQAANGGVSGKWVIATDSLFLIAEPQPALSAVNQARIYLDDTSLIVNASVNGGAYVPFGGSGGGGSAFSAITAGTNATAAMVVGTGASLGFSGSGAIDATKIHGTTVPAAPAADMVLITSSAGVGAWSGSVLNATGLTTCPDTGGNHLNYDTSTHIFSCGTTGGTVGSAGFGTLTAGTNTTAAMVVGTGSSLTVSGSGSINATAINNGAPPVSGSIWKSNGGLQPVSAGFADVVAMFSGGAGCSGTNLLAADGTCQTGGGSGSFLPLAGGTMSGNVLFANTTFNIGSSSFPPGTVWAGTGFASLSSASNALNLPNGGVLSQFATFNHATAPSITLQTSSSTIANWSAGATSAFTVRNSSLSFPFIVAQNGNIWINRTSDDGTGARLQVVGSGNIIAGPVVGLRISTTGGGESLNLNASAGLSLVATRDILINSSGFGAVNLGPSEWQPISDATVALGDSSHRFSGLAAVAVTATTIAVTNSVHGLALINALNVTGTITSPAGATLNGSFTCPAGQHFSQLIVSQGLLTNYSCTP